MRNAMCTRKAIDATAHGSTRLLALTALKHGMPGKRKGTHH